MSKQHTPGPWFIDTSLHIYSQGAPVANGEGGTTSTSIHLATANKAADAILMAAAPDLLTALKLFADQIRFGGASHEERLAAVAAADAAIAKATGSPA